MITTQAEILTVNNDSVSANLALQAQAANRIRKADSQRDKILGKGAVLKPLKRLFTLSKAWIRFARSALLIDVTELDVIPWRNFRLHQNAHLEILGVLGTAFAQFLTPHTNSVSIINLCGFWGLEDVWLESRPAYFRLFWI